MIKSFSFNPNQVTVGIGGKVIWTNEDQPQHTVTGSDWGSQPLSTGQTFTQADMAGTWRSHALVSKPSKWEYGVVSFDGSGVLTNLEYQDSNGENDPSGDSPTVNLDSTGKLTISQPLNPSFHGQASFDKKMAVFTETEAPGEYSLTIALKK